MFFWPHSCLCPMDVLVANLRCRRIRTQFVRLAKDTAIMGLLADRGVEECLPNGECSFPRSVA